jgi:hypothetical protein
MLVQAYQDPVSNRISATEEELSNFLVAQDSAQQDELTKCGSSTLMTKLKLTALKKYLIENLSYPGDLENLLNYVYSAYYALYNISTLSGDKSVIRGLSCNEITIYQQQVGPVQETYLFFILKVEYNSETSLFSSDTEMPPAVLGPFEVFGIGGSEVKPNGDHCLMLRAPVAAFPLLCRNLENHYRLQLQKTLHKVSLEERNEQAMASSRNVKDAENLLRTAQRDFSAANAAQERARLRYEAVLLADKKEKELVCSRVGTGFPFVKQLELVMSEEALGKFIRPF